MVDDGIFATTAQVQMYVPVWASDTYNEVNHINEYISRWEVYLCDVTGYDLVTNYGTLDAAMKKILAIYVSLKCAMNICDRDISGTDIRVAEFFYDSATAQIARLEPEIKKNVALIKTGK